jgi:hypothetical protein
VGGRRGEEGRNEGSLLGEFGGDISAATVISMACGFLIITFMILSV